MKRTEPAKKATNPKDAFGAKKVGRSVVPISALAQLSIAFLEGALKYGAHNWTRSGARASVYYDALDRHATRYWAGEDYDVDLFAKTGVKVHHLAKVMACCAIIIDAETRGVLVDDRPPAYFSVETLFEVFNEAAAALTDAYPDAPPPVTQEPLE